ncbi:Condensin-2 complex subunit G2 [Cyanidiococcus yangmingshanensis]|uniref:Condensin-2 complex subunit G2 n=1 Tax=Cyanidiococcus yangmingshanensis TaxID=2690220 RepID=A0A7J7IBH3_9RHOD|nr:Condensin-2 complex subunit G2 [Cyanidiococcus yangmingshanensis]
MSRNLCIDNRHVSSESSKSSCWPDPDKGAHTLEESRFFLSLLDEALFSNREETPSKDNRTAISQMRRLIDAVGRMVELPPSLSAETLRKLAANRGFDAVCECLLDALADACTCLYSVEDEDHQNMKRLRATSVLCLGAIAHLSTALLGVCAELNGNGTDTPPALLQTVQILHDLMLVLPKLTASNASGELEYENELPYAKETKPVSAKVQRMPDPHELVSHEAPYHESIPALAETDPVGETMGARDSGDLGLAEVLVIQDSIAEMCESFWKHNWVDRHLIAPHMIIFLLHLALGKYGDIDIPPAVVADKELAVMETHNQGSGNGRTWRLRHASLREDALRRLYEVRHAFFCLPVDQTTGSLSEIDGEDQGCCLTEPSETSLISDFVSAFEDLFVVQNVYGRKWLALCLSGVVSESLTDALHTSFKERLIFHLQGKRIMQHYAEMYFRAWCIANAAAKEGEIYIRSKLHFERVCLQDFAEKSILTTSPRLVRICRRILTAFHAQKRLPGVDHALACCYEPIIYRAMLRSTNPAVRRNACHLFFEAFPILREDGSSTSPNTRASGPQNIDAEHDGDPTALSANAIEEAEATEDIDTQLARQFSLLPRMLLDSSPKVRKISVEGTCRLLSVFWELFPPVMRTQLLQLLTGELAFDMCSSAVRESVCKSIRGLLETQTLAHPTLRAGILARLRPCLHDRNRNVRHAAAELVLAVSRAPDLRWYDVVSLQEDLLPYLAAGDTMDGRLTCLLLPSFFSGLDADLDGELDPPRYAGVLARCLEFVRVHAEAASNFYASLGSLSTHLPLWASKFPSLRVPCLRSICKFIVILGNGLVELDEDFRDESGEPIESDAGVTYARELAAPLFVILCDTYRGIAPVVYNGENEDCRSYLERLLPVHTFSLWSMHFQLQSPELFIVT